jgi:hypothetical protein
MPGNAPLPLGMEHIVPNVEYKNDTVQTWWFNDSLKATIQPLSAGRS